MTDQQKPSGSLEDQMAEFREVGEGTSVRPWRAAQSFSGVTLVSGLGAVVGLVSNGFIAYHFGATWKTDAFFLAQSIPLILAHLLQSGPLPSVFLPIFIRIRTERSPESAWRFFNNLLNLILVLSLFLAVLGYFLAPWIIRFVGVGFDESTWTTSVRVLRFLIITVLSHTVSGLLIIALNALNLFVLPAAFSLLPALGVVVCVAVFAPAMGLDAWILGNLIGPALFLLALLGALWSQGYRYRPILDFRQKELREVLRRVSQFFISSLFTQGQTLSTRLVASLLAPGSLSAIAYAERLFLAASALFTIPLPNVVFPELVRMKVADRLAELKSLLYKASRVLVLLLVPISLGMMAISGLVIGVLLQRGEFGSQDTFRTGWSLVLYFVALVPLGYKMLFTNLHHALGKTRVVVIGLCAAQGTIIIGNFLFVWWFDYLGIPVAHVLGQLVLVGVHVYFLKQSFELKGIFWNSSSRRSFLGAVLMGIVAVIFQWFWPNVFSGTFVGRGVMLVTVLLVSMFTYSALVLRFGVPEAKEAIVQLRQQFWKKQK